MDATAVDIKRVFTSASRRMGKCLCLPESAANIAAATGTGGIARSHDRECRCTLNLRMQWRSLSVCCHLSA